jgi:hypothetical protein
MDNKKFEQLIDLIINENEEKARALFHDIVVEKSREIYESMMDEEYTDSPVEGLLDEISAEEQGMTEEEDEFADIEMDGGEDDMEIDLDSDEMGDEGEGDLEDRVVDLEDKLDELMAEFEELMGQDSDNDMGDEEGSKNFGDEDMMEAKEDDELEESEELEEEDTLEESTNLIAVKNPVHGDNGQNAKSIVSGGSKVSSNGAKAVNFTTGEGGKGGTQGGVLNPATKDLKGAGQFKNAPGKNNFSEKGEAAPKPTHGDNGSNTKSITSESRKTTKKIVK